MLAGIVVSDRGGVFALGNAANTIFAELGSLFFHVYLYHKSDRNYYIFVAVYAASRACFALWSVEILRQFWAGLPPQHLAPLPPASGSGDSHVWFRLAGLPPTMEVAAAAPSLFRGGPWYGDWIRPVGAVLQLSLLTVNCVFLRKHLIKVWRKLKGRQKVE